MGMFFWLLLHFASMSAKSFFVFLDTEAFNSGIIQAASKMIAGQLKSNKCTLFLIVMRKAWSKVLSACRRKQGGDG